MKHLKDSINKSAPYSSTQAQAQLIALADESHKTALILEGELDKIKTTPGRKSHAISQWAKRAWRRKRLENIEKDVQRYTSVMEMGLLNRIW